MVKVRLSGLVVEGNREESLKNLARRVFLNARVSLNAFGLFKVAPKNLFGSDILHMTFGNDQIILLNPDYLERGKTFANEYQNMLGREVTLVLDYN